MLVDATNAILTLFHTLCHVLESIPLCMSCFWYVILQVRSVLHAVVC